MLSVKKLVVGSSLGFLLLLWAGMTLNLLSSPHEERSPVAKSFVRSDLTIPQEAVLLHRPQLIKLIAKKLEGKESIQTVALVGIVGMGGVGKTTLARQFGRLHKASVAWELNAETQASLMVSFKDLAHELARTKEHKGELNHIQSIQDVGERDKQLLSFVRKRLKENPGWVLIYDNVESFSNAQPYFPTDPDLWGWGKVLITTRDAHMKNASTIKPENIIQIDELTQEEALTLVSKILYGCNPTKLTSAQRKDVLTFLKTVPPFPLDVSVAAYYIKNNRLSFRQYLARLDGFKETLERPQQTLLKGVSGYEETRYGIITSSLAKMIEINPEFRDLLLFIGLLDSQNIPRSLLEFYKSPALVKAFVHELKKYSLITAESTLPLYQLHAFSIHRSTQAIVLIYLTKLLDLEKNQKLTQQISIVFGSYLNKLIERENLPELKFFMSHGEAFLGHHQVIPANARLLIKGYLGCIFCYLREDTKSRQFLEESLEPLSQRDLRTPDQICKILIYLGNIYMEQGDNQKAKECVDKALLLYKDYLSKNQADVGRSLSFLGYVYVQTGEYDKAKSTLERSLRAYAEPHDDEKGFARALTFMGDLCNLTGDYEKATKYLDQGLLICRKHFPESCLAIACASLYLGNAYIGLGDYEKAKSILEHSIEIYKEIFPEIHPDTAWAMLSLVDVYMSLKDYKRAEGVIQKSLEIHEHLFGKSNIRTAEAFLRLGNVYRGLKEYPKAKETLKRTLIIYEQAYGKGHLQVAQVLKDLALVYLEEGQLKTAEELLVEGLKIFQQSKHPDAYLFLENLADLQVKKSRESAKTKDSQKAQEFKKEAINYLQQALEVVKTHFSPNYPHTARIQSKLKELSV